MWTWPVLNYPLVPDDINIKPQAWTSLHTCAKTQTDTTFYQYACMLSHSVMSDSLQLHGQ